MNFQHYLKENIVENWYQNTLHLEIPLIGYLYAALETPAWFNSFFDEENNASVYAMKSECKRPFVILDIRIEPEYRHKGYAMRLLKRAIELSKRVRPDSILLNAQPEDKLTTVDMLERFYGKAGFQTFFRGHGHVLMRLER